MEQDQPKCFTLGWLLPTWSSTLLLLVLLSFAGLSFSQVRSVESPSDGLALLPIKFAVDRSGALASWSNTSLGFCQWQGVRCSTHGGERRVTALDLRSLGLAGRIFPFLSNLTFLRHLQLSNNSLEGPIPQELSIFSQLRHLDLSDNPLGGMIPTTLTKNCSKLKTLILSKNNLSGPIPRNLSRCLHLQIINFSDNMLEGEIPSDLSSLSMLYSFVLRGNGLTGTIPSEIGHLASLKEISISYNNLNGTIPTTLGNLSSLTDLDLAHNNFQPGAIPSEIWNLTSLTALALVNISLTGGIPSDIGNLEKLAGVYMSNNNLVGPIPRSLGSLKNLYNLFLDDNNLQAWDADDWSFFDALTNSTNLNAVNIGDNDLSGLLPKSVANLSRNLEKLYLYNNRIAGSIPEGIWNTVSLTIIVIGGNRLNGTIPAALGSLPRLGQLGMGRNLLTGNIPATIGNLTMLNILTLNNNQLQGPIPPSLGDCPLNRLNLSSNRLTGTVPKEILAISSLSVYFDVSNNALTGILPSEIRNLRVITTIDVSNNKLSGIIPTALAECQGLQSLSMQGNNFEGPIPASLSEIRGLQVLNISSNNLSGNLPDLSQLTGLQVLDVSSNNLSGHIPDFLSRLPGLHYLNLSYNDFSGVVPEDGIFNSTSTFSVSGNKRLCGGVQELDLPSCYSTKTHMSWKIIVVISVAGGIFSIFLIFFFARLFKSRSRLSSSNSFIGRQHRMVSYAELLKATNGFSPANLIGMGSFGSVYKGVIDWEDHKDVAVKVLNLQQIGALRSFTAECEVLRNIRHRNLIRILTSCSGVDYQGNDFKALLFQFLPNGSLDKWIHPEGTLSVLSFIQRLNISIDVASALVYLHHHGPKPVVHCDIKPSNVLLDHNFVAHVGDFGLARFLHKAVSTSLECSKNSATLKGSIGYAAPEYGTANKVTTQGDVYSYGILLLEMFTGKQPTDDRFKNGQNLHQYVEVAFPERVVEIIDPYLLSEGTNLLSNGAGMRIIDCITSVLKVGILCSKESAKERMHMADVSRELHVIRNAFLSFNPLQG